MLKNLANFFRQNRIQDKEYFSPIEAHQSASFFSKNAVEDFFTDQSTYPKKILQITIACVVIAILLLLLVKFTNLDDYLLWKLSGDQIKQNIAVTFSMKESGKFLAEQLVAIAISVMASILAVGFLNGVNFRRNFIVRQIAHDELLKSVFNTLGTYNQQHRFDQKIEITLQPCAESTDILLMHLSVDHYTYIKRNSLVFFFNRYVDDSNPVSKIFSPFEYEFHSSMNESKFLALLGGDQQKLDALFSVNNVYVDNDDQHISLEKEANNSKWEYKIGQTLPSDKMLKIQFRLTLPVHKRGYYYITPVFPTNGLQVIFDYAAVSDKITVNCDNLLSSTDIFSRPPKSENSRITVKHSGWVIPKSSVFFNWNEKTVVEKKMPPETMNAQEPIKKPSKPNHDLL